MLCIHLNRITEQGVDQHERTEASALPLLTDLTRSEGIRFFEPIRVRLQAAFAGESVRIAGEVKASVRLPCSRCLTAFDREIKTQFSVTAVPDPPPFCGDETADEIELTAPEMEVITYSGTRIDLRTEVAQQLILALPLTPRCNEACRGLCSQCGANLNQSRCRCDPADTGNPFAALRNLSLPTPKD